MREGDAAKVEAALLVSGNLTPLIKRSHANVYYDPFLSQLLLSVCFDTFEGCNSLEGDWLNRQLNRYLPIEQKVKQEEITLFPSQPLDKVAGRLY